jgi:hypothetical protein
VSHRPWTNTTVPFSVGVTIGASWGLSESCMLTPGQGATPG